MNAPLVTHPSREELKAFGLGKLDSAASETILLHLSTCQECRRTVAGTSGDSFLGRLRDARKPDGTHLPEQSKSGLARNQNATPSHKVHSPPPELLNCGEYERLEELGRGGMGVVYRVHNTMMGRDEVLKVMGREVMDRPGAIDRFRREIQSAARLDHPNVVRAYSARLLGDLVVFSMEFVPGNELGKLVKSRGALPITNACYYAQQVAKGLQHAHEKGMVHRDIKPANLILSVEGKKHVVKILDFGLAKATSENKVDGGLTGEGKMMGTPDYIAPEQAMDAANADTRADIYSLGCTLYHLLSGDPPFSGSSLLQLLQAHRTIEAKRLNMVRPEVPAELAAVVAKMMAKDPAKRFQTPVEVAKALGPFVLKIGAVSTKPQRELSQGTVSTAVPKSTIVPGRGMSVAPQSVPVAKAPVKKAWETIVPEFGEEPVTPSTRGRTAIGTRVPVRPRQLRLPVRVWRSVAVGAAFVLLVGLCASAVFKLKTKEGTIVLEDLPPDAEVLVDGDLLTVTHKGEEARVSLNKGGPHRLKVVQGGKEIYSSDLTVNIGGEPVRVRIESLDTAKPVPPKILPADGFVQLFNGKDLTGWVVDSGDKSAWRANDGNLVALGGEESIQSMINHGFLFSERVYSDFVLRLQFQQVSPNAWGGVALRAVPCETSWSVDPTRVPRPQYDIPCQLTVLTGGENLPDMASGSLWWSNSTSWRLAPDNLAKMNMAGEWNDLENEMRGQSLRVAVNGRDVQNVMLNKSKPPTNPMPGLNRYSGRIGFLKRVGEMRYRNINIKDLSKQNDTPNSGAVPTTTILGPEKSEWAGSGKSKDDTTETLIGAAWTFTERRGNAFKALWRGGYGRKMVFEGVIDTNGRITFETREILEPDTGPREPIKGSGEIGPRWMTIFIEEPDNSQNTHHLDFKLLSDGGKEFNIQGRWRCFHRPNGWMGIRTVTDDNVATDRPPIPATWERDGGLIYVRFDGGGLEWLVIDPDNPNELRGSNRIQAVTWIR